MIEDPALLPSSPIRETYAAAREGYITRIEPRAIGRAIVAMGGGRQKVDDQIDPGVGFRIGVEPGDKVRKGDPLATIHAANEEQVKIGRAALDSAIGISEHRGEPALPLISHRITKDGFEEMGPGAKSAERGF